MTNKFQDIIKEELLNIIDNDFIFLDLPYYTNIGDTLIWKGTEEFLKTLPYKCLYKSAIETYVKPNITKDVIVILQGGGNFGDTWRRHTNFCLTILKEFPQNKIIILPQTVYYSNEKILKQDAREMALHQNLTICARDNVTHDLLKQHFSKNKILLLPDMAFCIPESYLKKFIQPEQDKQLFFKRKDKEYYNYDFLKYLNHSQIEEHEWPSMEYDSIGTKILYKLKRVHNLFKRLGFCKRFSGKLVDLYAVKIYLPTLLKIGIQFISQYQYVYSTRLHGAILSILLNKPITFFDNTYGKNSAFFNTWLKNLSNVTFIKKY